ncbi:hypothetical protein Q3304_09250 [Clostridioides sp. GD02377]|uniref:hypothetical protein n=1 Tax=unclassified Clostridioides TaxID=2635829 RepID=UPI0038AEFACF
MDEKILTLLQEMNCRFDAIDKRFDYIYKDIVKISVDIEDLKDNTQNDFIEIRTEIDFIEKYLTLLKDDTTEIKKSLDTI